MRTFALLISLVAGLAAAHAKDPPNAVRDDWTALLAGKCDLIAHRVRTPIGAAVLRNTAYALAGYTFKSKGLTALFSADGGWYQPKGNQAPTFSPEIGDCILKLKTLEATWKPVNGDDKPMKEAIFKDRSTYLEVRGHSKLMDGGPSEWAASGRGAEVKCRTCKALQYFQIECEGDACMVIVPGTGDLP